MAKFPDRTAWCRNDFPSEIDSPHSFRVDNAIAQLETAQKCPFSSPSPTVAERPISGIDQLGSVCLLFPEGPMEWHIVVMSNALHAAQKDKMTTG